MEKKQNSKTLNLKKKQTKKWGWMAVFVIIEKEEHSKWSMQSERNGEFMTGKLTNHMV